MIKFRCGHCGHRIALSRRRMNRVAVCPECRQPTHPMAEQVLKHRPAAPTGPAASGRVCENCNLAIGRLQKPHVWGNHIVCAECQRKLSAEGAPSPATALAIVPTTPVSVTRKPASPAKSGATTFDPDPYVRPFRGGLFGALVGLCVAAAALYGALNLLRDVAGLLTGLAFGGLALLAIYLVVRWMILPGEAPDPSPRPKRLSVGASSSSRRSTP